MRASGRRRRRGLILVYGLGAAAGLSLGAALTSPDARHLFRACREALLHARVGAARLAEPTAAASAAREDGAPGSQRPAPESSDQTQALEPASALWGEAWRSEPDAAIAPAEREGSPLSAAPARLRDALSSAASSKNAAAGLLAASRPPAAPGGRTRRRGSATAVPSTSRAPGSRAPAIGWPEPPARPVPDYDGRSSAPPSAAFPFLKLRGMRRPPPANAQDPSRVATPPVLVEWAGPGPLRPPADAAAPDFERLRVKTPGRLPFGGAALDKTPPPPEFFEKLVPLEKEGNYAAWRKSCGTRRFHWHKGSGGRWYYHQGAAWGYGQGGHWVWTQRQGGAWWAAAEGASLLRHEGRWWWKTRDGWFLLHQGVPWSWRRFPDWGREGLLQPASGTRIVYSEDGLRAAVVLATGEWAVFDARTGARLETGLDGEPIKQ